MNSTNYCSTFFTHKETHYKQRLVRRLNSLLILALLFTNMPAFGATSRVIETSAKVGELVKADGGDGDHAFIGLELRSKLWTLIGEPVTLCVARWTLSSVSIGGKAYSRNDIPTKVWQQITLYDAKIHLRLYSKAFGFFYYQCDPGVFSSAGDAQASFNVPGSPDWSKLFYRLPSRVTEKTSYFPSLDAKAAFKDPLTTATENYLLDRQQIEQLHVNLVPVRLWLAENARQKLAKQQQQTEQSYRKASDNFDDFFDNIEHHQSVNQDIQKKQRQLADIQQRQSSYQQERQQSYDRLTKLHCNPGAKQALEKAESLQQALEANFQAYNQCHKEGRQWTVYTDEKSRLKGFKNRAGEIVIPARFKYAEPFQQGLALVAVNSSEYGRTDYLFINTSGQQAFNATFKEAKSFSDGLAAVRSSNSQWGYINRQGDQVIPGQFNSAHSFSEGLAAVIVSENSRHNWGFINSQARIVIPPQFYQVGAFKGGKAYALKFRRRKNHGKSVCDGWTDYYDQGDIDTTGNWVVPPKTYKKSGGELCLQRE